MAKDGWRDRLTSADWKNWQAAHQRFLDQEAELWATNPNNPNIATGIYPPGMRQLIPNHERGSCSPLGGVAVASANAPLRSTKEGK